ncbi:MAG: molybdopterin converting factor subunit 1 [Methylococcaceae bacterium]|nr:molybdopterin converting factor subunit 1 [Methylococcaceae bacterium]
MSIKVRYFASLKESVGRSEDVLEIVGNTSVIEVWQQANEGLRLPDNILAAVNMEYVALDNVVKEGDEVAFFPPVTGG